jgi:hypothetical protein
MMVEFLNCLQGRDEMIREFKFFHGVKGKFTVSWTPEHNAEDLFGFSAEGELTRLLSEQIAEEIDNEIVSELTRRINGGMRA